MSKERSVSQCGPFENRLSVAFLLANEQKLQLALRAYVRRVLLCVPSVLWCFTTRAWRASTRDGYPLVAALAAILGLLVKAYERTVGLLYVIRAYQRSMVLLAT
jgi:hypothetical protein